MDPKLTILFALIGVIISFSHLRDPGVARMKQVFVRRGRREFVRQRPAR